jgi:hypothetical protein
VIHQQVNSAIHVAVDQASDNEKIPSAAVERLEELLAKGRFIWQKELKKFA